MVKQVKPIEHSSNQYRGWIEKALEKKIPSADEIRDCLFGLQTDNSLSNFEFFDIIGEIFQRKPVFFMLSIYPRMRRKFRKVYGNEGLQVMDKYILEKFCLAKEEQLIHEYKGTIKQKITKKYMAKVVNGSIYVTNRRIIAQGNLVFEVHQSTEEAKISYISGSAPCYGYLFPIKNLHKLTPLSDSKNRKLSYFISQRSKITINIPEKEGTVDKLHAFLSDFQTQKPIEPLEPFVHKAEEKKGRVEYKPKFDQKSNFDCGTAWICCITPIMVIIIIIVFLTSAMG